jgi:hypothetical protein
VVEKALAQAVAEASIGGLLPIDGAFFKDLKYNGPHICPRCGCQSHWRATGINTEMKMITVRCEGGCREYIMAYQQLSYYALFKEP